MPTALPVTSTLTVQLAPAASDPPVRRKLVAPAVAVTVPAPHVVDAAGVLATTTPVGNGSDDSASPVSAYAPVAVFAIVTVSVDVPP